MKSKTRGITRPLFGLLLVTLATTACEQGAFGFYGDRATLDITVRKGPIDPAGGSGQDNEEPVAGARVVARPFSGDFTREGLTDAAGNLSYQVAPGRWQIIVETCPGAQGTPPEQTITVQPGGQTTVRFLCDTGIR
jgi:hypothetical protein